ncbi:LTA synthase family protein [Candidatus Saccharibacteria bacterium]|nr:LTA synthase family protein [Candidatus Saccharibacteria bacterium]
MLDKLKKLDFGLHKKFMIFTVIFLVVAAVALTWFLQYRYFINNIDRTWEFMWGRPLVFWYNVLLMLLILIFLTGFTRRPVVAAGLMWAFIIALTYVHINKFSVRGFPLLPEDFALASEAASLSKFINMGALIQMIIAILLVLGLTFLANFWATKKFDLKKHRRKYKKWWRRWAIASRVLMILISAALFLGLTDFVRNHEGQRYEDIGWLNTQLVAWNQVRNYDYNGFILGFLYNMSKFELQEPEGYSEERIAEILAKYKALAKKANAERIDLGKEDINVIIILNESFFDPSISYSGYSFRDFYPYSSDRVMLPTLRKMQAKYASGYMYSTDYGGGTANVEMEALTGLTNYWANTVPYTDLIPRAGEISSVASFLKAKGFKTTAIHPFNGSMYKRNIALNHFGYDTFITELEMKYKEKEGKSEYINDRSAYLQVLDVLKSSKQNQVITLITMQNHLPYNPDIYAVTDFTITDMSIEEGRRKELEIYYQMLHNSDKYLGEFLAELDQSEKKAVVLFFGDHAAGIFSQVNDNPVKEIRDLARLVPYFVYTNFDTGGPKQKQLSITTPNCLSNAMFNVLGAKKPELFYLMDTVCVETPVLANAWFGNEAPEVTKALYEYELINYDLLSGKKYWMK